jgi:hypothetical protein
LAGEWREGILSGPASYQQPAFQLSATYVKGIPAGSCTYTSTAFRKLGKFPEACAGHIRSPEGPVLVHHGIYAIPAGADKDPEIDEDGNAVEDTDAPKMPEYPKYAGLTYESDTANPAAGPIVAYPPEGAVVPPCVKPPSFSIAAGLTVA